jgi:predicted small metal-binding protein
MTCSQMGGSCDAEITAATPDEMMMKGMAHLEDAHPEMSPEDPMMVSWVKKFHEDYEAAPETAE